MVSVEDLMCEIDEYALLQRDLCDALRTNFGVEKAEKRLWKKEKELRAAVEERDGEILRLRALLLTEQNRLAIATSALEDIASEEIVRSHCVGPHCTEETCMATSGEMANRAAGALDAINPCQTCNGVGAVGNIVTAQPCPDCSQEHIHAT